MNKILFSDLVLGFSLTACHQQKRPFTPEINTNNPVNDPSSMKQKIVTELGLLDISKIISDLNEVQARIGSIPKNSP